MQSVQSLLGLPVVETETAKQIGTIHEIVFDMQHSVVHRIVITDDDWFVCRQGVDFVNLFRIGRDAVMVRNRRFICDLKEEDPASFPWYVRDLHGKEFVTETGLSLGNLVDILYNRSTGEIQEYELSDGTIADLLYGRAVIPLPQAQVIGPERVVVPEKAADLLAAK